ncbi:MAG: hypothetical protein SGARI_000671 [Bacillariaceae sp.]
MTLESFDFDAYARRVPTHILGFSSDFERMQKRLKGFHHAMDQNPDVCQQGEGAKWNALSSLEQEECEANLQDLKHQKSTLLAMSLQPAASPRPATKVSPVPSPETTQASTKISAGMDSRKRKATEGVDEEGTTEASPASRTRSALAWQAPEGSFSGNAKKQKTVAPEEPVKRKSSLEWTLEEDQLLRKAVEEEGLSPNAAAVKYFSGKRTDNACRKRWNYKLKPQKREVKCQAPEKNKTSTYPSWSPREDAILKNALVEERLTYAEAARICFGGTRTANACRKRWHCTLKNSIEEKCEAHNVHKKLAYGAWMPKEDDILRKAIEEEGMSVKEAAETYFVGSRSKSACSHRWNDNLKHTKATESIATMKRNVIPTSQAQSNDDSDAEDDNESCCHVCHNGGDLVCCDGCPQVYHSGCVVAGKSRDALLADVDPWYCPDCFLQQDYEQKAKETVAASNISESAAAKNAASEKPRAWEKEEDDLILKRLEQGLLEKDIVEELSGRTTLEVRERCDTVLDPCFDVRQKARKAMESHRRASEQNNELATATLPTCEEKVSSEGSNNAAAKETNSGTKFSTNSTNLNAWFSAPPVQHSNLYDNDGYDI